MTHSDNDQFDTIEIPAHENNPEHAHAVYHPEEQDVIPVFHSAQVVKIPGMTAENGEIILQPFINENYCEYITLDLAQTLRFNWCSEYNENQGNTIIQAETIDPVTQCDECGSPIPCSEENWNQNAFKCRTCREN